MSTPIVNDTLKTYDDDGNLIQVNPKTVVDQIEDFPVFIVSLAFNDSNNSIIITNSDDSIIEIPLEDMSKYVTLEGNQTIPGEKTFDKIILSSGIEIY